MNLCSQLSRSLLRGCRLTLRPLPLSPSHCRVVPGFYGNDTATDAEHAVQDGRLLAKLEAYWDWIKDDKRMVGLNPYHWVRFSLLSWLHALCF